MDSDVVRMRIKAQLKACGMSSAELGRRLGMTGQSMTLKLQGKRPIKLEELLLICEALGLGTGELFSAERSTDHLQLGAERFFISGLRMLSANGQDKLLATLRKLLESAP